MRIETHKYFPYKRTGRSGYNLVIFGICMRQAVACGRWYKTLPDQSLGRTNAAPKLRCDLMDGTRRQRVMSFVVWLPTSASQHLLRDRLSPLYARWSHHVCSQTRDACSPLHEPAASVGCGVERKRLSSLTKASTHELKDLGARPHILFSAMDSSDQCLFPQIVRFSGHSRLSECNTLTLIFVEIFFQIVPSALLLLAFPWRIRTLLSRQSKVRGCLLHVTKLVSTNTSKDLPLTASYAQISGSDCGYRRFQGLDSGNVGRESAISDPIDRSSYRAFSGCLPCDRPAFLL